ncbi:hypothetical protein, partial [Salmonella enterica]|uniref:hypothetical protein n=1 Tax=Salmonella enterica TaxID=28901 RepID=UPI001877FBE5|nr:hypothetical protein [Salmonella enterica subsp. enterica serovar Typhimurium]
EVLLSVARLLLQLSLIGENVSGFVGFAQDVLAAEAMGELVQALGELDALMRELGAGDEADAQRQLLNEAFGEVKA